MVDTPQLVYKRFLCYRLRIYVEGFWAFVTLFVYFLETGVSRLFRNAEMNVIRDFTCRTSLENDCPRQLKHLQNVKHFGRFVVK